MPTNNNTESNIDSAIVATHTSSEMAPPLAFDFLSPHSLVHTQPWPYRTGGMGTMGRTASERGSGFLLAALYLLQDLVGAVETVSACVPDVLHQLLRCSVALSG